MNCKNYEPCPEPPVFSYFLGKPLEYWIALEQKHDTVFSNFKILEGNYDRLYDENQRLIKENCYFKDPAKWNTPTVTTIWGKPLEYYTDLEQKYNRLETESVELFSAHAELETENRHLIARLDKANNALQALRNIADGV
jgi:hypothetical protein